MVLQKFLPLGAFPNFFLEVINLKTSTYGTKIIPIGLLLFQKTTKTRLLNWPFFTTYMGSLRLFSQFLLKLLINTWNERSSPVQHWTNAKNWTKKWFENKNLVKNYKIWTLRFLPFPILKSLALSTELFGGLIKNCSSNLARYASRLLAQKFLSL